MVRPLEQGGVKVNVLLLELRLQRDSPIRQGSLMIISQRLIFSGDSEQWARIAFIELERC